MLLGMAGWGAWQAQRFIPVGPRLPIPWVGALQTFSLPGRTLVPFSNPLGLYGHMPFFVAPSSTQTLEILPVLQDCHFSEAVGVRSVAGHGCYN